MIILGAIVKRIYIATVSRADAINQAFGKNDRRPKINWNRRRAIDYFARLHANGKRLLAEQPLVTKLPPLTFFQALAINQNDHPLVTYLFHGERAVIRLCFRNHLTGKFIETLHNIGIFPTINNYRCFYHTYCHRNSQ